MPIVVCHKCQTRLTASDELIGEDITCLKCFASVVVPHADQAKPEAGAADATGPSIAKPNTASREKKIVLKAELPQLRKLFWNRENVLLTVALVCVLLALVGAAVLGAYFQFSGGRASENGVASRSESKSKSRSNEAEQGPSRAAESGGKQKGSGDTGAGDTGANQQGSGETGAGESTTPAAEAPKETPPNDEPKPPLIWKEQKLDEIGVTLKFAKGALFFHDNRVDQGKKCEQYGANHAAGGYVLRVHAEKYPDGFPDPKHADLDELVKAYIEERLKQDNPKIVDVTINGVNAKEIQVDRDTAGKHVKTRIVTHGVQRVWIGVTSANDLETREIKEYLDSVHFE